MGENKSYEFAIPKPKNCHNFSDIRVVDEINHDNNSLFTFSKSFT